jgi:hypothetical protein
MLDPQDQLRKSTKKPAGSSSASTAALGGPLGPFTPRSEGSDMHVFAQLYLKTLFILFLSPLSPGGPEEGPDCHLSREIGGFGPIPARIQWGMYF